MLTVKSARSALPANPATRFAPGNPFGPWKASWYAVQGVLLAIATLVVVPILWAAWSDGQAGSVVAMRVRLVVLAGSFATLLSWLVAVGVAVTGQRAGVLWTARNAYSLSRLQITLWTLLVLSTLAAVVACRAQGLFVPPGSGGMSGALNIQIPTELLMVMGISVTSAAATPAILSVKAQSEVMTPQQVDAAGARMKADVSAVGRVLVRDANCPPLLKDLFQGDEVAKAGVVDIGKVQQAVVTLLLWAAYLGMVVELFTSGDAKAGEGLKGVTALPPMSETFVYLLGISHAGYLAFKAAPSPGSAPGSTTTPGALPSQVLPRPAPPVIRAQGQ